jgi:hypothetical protein
MAGGINSRLGRHDEALFHLGKGVELSDRAPFYVSYEAWGFARAGRTKEARAGLEELKARATTEHVQPLFRAVPLSALGEMDEAFRVLDEAAAARNGWLASPRMPMFENFRGDARFRELLRRIGHADAED